MATDKKPTKEQVARLSDCLLEFHKIIGDMMAYHNKRTSFFKNCNLILNFINILSVMVALFLIGLNLAEQAGSIASIKNSLWAAGIAVLLLFFGILFDFSKKEETNRLLTKIYRGYNKEIASVKLMIWSDLTNEEYKQGAALYHRLNEGVCNLKGDAFPILEFELFLCSIREKITEEKQGRVFLKVKCWQYLFASYFSMPNACAKFIAKHNYEERQQQQQEETSEPKTP